MCQERRHPCPVARPTGHALGDAGVGVPGEQRRPRVVLFLRLLSLDQKDKGLAGPFPPRCALCSAWPRRPSSTLLPKACLSALPK